jgi:putative peptidoglycan lipid II flippase
MDRLRTGRLGLAALVVGGGILLSRILGVLREIVFAAMLGANAVTDQYVAAFRIPDFANYLLAGGFLTITFIPIFSKYLASDDEGEGWNGFTAILRWLAIGITALIVVAWFAAPTVLTALYPEFTADQLAGTIRLTRIVLPAQFAFVVGALFAAVQYAKGVFTIPTLAPVIYNLAIIGGGIVYAVVTGTADPEGFIWGALVGAFVGNLAIQWWGARRVGLALAWTAPWRHPAVRQYVLIAIPLMIGQSIVALDDTLMSVFGDRVGDGAQTQLQFARRTMLVPVGVIAQAAAVAAYPFLARLFAEGRISAMNRMVDRSLKWVLATSIGATGLLAAMSVPVIRALFERFAFGRADSAAAAAALFFYAFAIPIWGGLQILTRAFYARRQMWTPVIVGTAVTAAAIPIYIVLTDRFGIEGVALASTLSLALYTVLLAAAWYRGADGGRRLWPVLDSAGRAVPLTVVGAAAAFVLSSAIADNVPGHTTLVNLLSVVMGSLAFLAVAVGLGGYLSDVLSAGSLRTRARRRMPVDDEHHDVMELL